MVCPTMFPRRSVSSRARLDPRPGLNIHDRHSTRNRPSWTFHQRGRLVFSAATDRPCWCSLSTTPWRHRSHPLAVIPIHALGVRMSHSKLQDRLNQLHETRCELIRLRSSYDAGLLSLRYTPTRTLAALYPDVAEEWHPTKNGVLAPNHVGPGSEKKAWWRCPRCGAVYCRRIATQVHGAGTCPQCKTTRTQRLGREDTTI